MHAIYYEEDYENNISFLCVLLQQVQRNNTNIYIGLTNSVWKDNYILTIL